MRSRKIAVFVAGLLLAVTLVWAETARELNTRGYRLYQQKKDPEALACFRGAAADESHALAHYNLAGALCILRDQGKVCEYDAYRGNIIHHLRRSIELDPQRASRMKTDPDLKCVHDTFGYQALSGLSPTKSAELTKILEAVT